MRKITHIINNLEIGGAEKMLIKLLNNGNGHKHIVNMIGKNSHSNDINKDIKIDSLNISKKNIFNIFFILFKFNNIIKKEKTEVIVCWLYHSCLFVFFYRFLFNKKIKIIWNIRQVPPNFLYEKKLTFLVFKFCSFFSKNVDGIIFNSRDSISKHKILSFSNKNIFYIPNGFENPKKYALKDYDNNLLSKIRGKTIISMFARYHLSKGHKLFLETFSSILKNNNNILLLMGGSGIDYNNKELNDIANKNDMHTNLIFLGPVKNIDKYIQISNFVVNCSLSSEGFPNIIGETIMNKKICLSSDISDNKEILNFNQCIFKSNNSLSLENKVLEILKIDNEKIKNITSSIFINFSNRYNINKVVNVYEKILNKF